MEIRFERGPEIEREQRTLPAAHYRLIRLLFSRGQSGNLFVPIRSMQYLGVLDREEIVFVDGQGARVIELAWRDFQAGERTDLQAPVSYTCVYYLSKGRAIMPRLQREFCKALELMESRLPKQPSETVTPIKRG